MSTTTTTTTVTMPTPTGPAPFSALPPAKPLAAEPAAKTVCKAHIKDICFSRMYIGGHFDAPFESYRLDAAVTDLVSGTGVPRQSLLPLTCFLYKGYLWTLNNRRLWVLRHAFAFSGAGPEVDVVVLPDTVPVTRRESVARLPVHKQGRLAHPGFVPALHGDEPQLQKLLLRPVMFRFDVARRNGYQRLPEGDVVPTDPRDSAASSLKLPKASSTPAYQLQEREKSFAGAAAALHSIPPTASTVGVSKGKAIAASASWSVNSAKSGSRAPGLQRPESKDMAQVVEETVLVAQGKEKDLKEVAKKFKEAVSHLRLVLDSLDAALDKLAS